MQIKFKQIAELPKKADVDKYANWIIIFAQHIPKTFAYAKVLTDRRKATTDKAIDTIPLVCDLPNTVLSHVTYVCIDDDIASFDLLTLARKLVAGHSAFNSKQIAIAVVGFNTVQSEWTSEALIAAVLSHYAVMPNFKSDNQPEKKKLAAIRLYGINVQHDFRRTFAMAEGNNLARFLSILPANELTPSIYLRKLTELQKEHQWGLEFYDTDYLRKYKAGAFLAVAQASPMADAGIVKLTYKPVGKSTKQKLSLVGKGICYDTGGTNLKPAEYMFGMHEDMQGSAVALGTFLALTHLQVDFSIECWLALASNHIGPKAYKPNDVVTASDGTTIEIVHTDAEGRMVLADTLAMASLSKPNLIIDYATLTGACIQSLGTAYSGVFTNRESWFTKLIEVGKVSGERVWAFPMDKDYDQHLDSTIADIKQCSLKSGIDHILAARFLQRFVKNNTPWIHIDLSSSNRKGGLAHIPTDTTGFGVRFAIYFLLDNMDIWATT